MLLGLRAPGRAYQLMIGQPRAYVSARLARARTSASPGSMLSASLWLRPSLQGVKIIAVGTCRAT